MTHTLTTEAMQEIYEAAVHVEAVGDDQDAGFELLCKLEDVGGTGATIRKLIDMVRAANREAQPVAATQIYQIWDDGRWYDAEERIYSEVYNEACKSQFRIVYTASPEQREAQPAQAPFMYAICNPDGSAWLDENCVACTAEELKPVLNDLRRDTGDGFRIVPLFTAPLAPANVNPVAFDEIADAVKEVTGGIRMEFTPGTYKGRQPVPFMNFTSLSRIVEMFRINPSAPQLRDGKPVCLLTIGAKTLADHSVAWTAAGMQLGKGIHRLYASPQSPAYPERLPCPVHLLPGLKFGKGISTRVLLEALARRAEYNAEMEAMTPEERAEHDDRAKLFKAMLPQPAPEI